MSPQSTSQIVVGASGQVMVAPVGTTAPLTPVDAWPAGWVDLGYLTDEGVSFTDSKEIESLTVWQLFYAARMIVTGREATLGMQLRQWSKDTVPLAFGGGTIVTTAGPPAHYRYAPPAPATIDERSMGIQWKDGTKNYRLIVPKGMVVDEVETQLVKTDAANLPIGFRVLGTDGADPWYLRTDDPAFA